MLLLLKPFTAALLIVLFTCALTGCTKTTSPDFYLSAPTPYVKQDPQQCGVATLQMVLEREGIPYNRKELLDEVYIPALNGTTFGVMKRAVESRGGAAHLAKGDNLDLAEWLASGYSPIIYWGRSAAEQTGHFLVVTGLSNDHQQVQVHNGIQEGQYLGIEHFLKRWGKGKNQALLVHFRQK